MKLASIQRLRIALKQQGVPLTEYPKCPGCESFVEPKNWDRHKAECGTTTPPAHER